MGVQRLLDSYRAIPPNSTVRLAKPTSNLFRARDRSDAKGLDVSGLTNVIAVDAEARTADVAGMCTYEDLVAATLPPEVLAAEPRIKPVRALSPQWQLVQIPRYKDFTEIVQGLLDRGISLAEIAGNREIMVTVIAPKDARLDVKDAAQLFSLDLDARPGFRRAGLTARIDRLVDINRELKAQGATIEHFYDY